MYLMGVTSAAKAGGVADWKRRAEAPLHPVGNGKTLPRMNADRRGLGGSSKDIERESGYFKESSRGTSAAEAGGF